MLAHMVSLVMLACAVSLDGFGVGVTYGLRRIRIPLLSILIIACCSGFVIGVSMVAGQWLSNYLSPVAGQWIGAIILIGIGLFAIIQFVRRAGNETEERQENGQHKTDEPGIGSSDGGLSLEEQQTLSPTMVMIVELKRLGIVIHILRKPQAADMDRSGTISASEALLLGCALSLDAFGAGLGAALLGFSPLWTSLLIAVASGSFLLIGLRVGFRFATSNRMRALSLLPGLILVMMGILKLM
ncbi:MntP/YtaF family protein [Paenibacillus daejeonensis]|uniref:MntP/YtaF family protein n=1 Tax=Paenibacillus daejeonensis TaxID=135193 RepID=UPI000360DC1D|nr:MntP/YtaF family protein [Paenibacillus daejeonensis]